MDYTEYQDKYGSDFKSELHRVLGIISCRTIAELLDSGETEALGALIAHHMAQALKDAEEADMMPDDQYLDDPRHGQAASLNAENCIFLRRQAD